MSRKCTVISDERGSSLIVVGLFMMAMGMLSVGGLQIYSQFSQAKKANETQERLEILKDAMLAYFSQHGRFPCPAPLSATMDSAEYGQEADSPCAVLETEEETTGTGTGTETGATDGTGGGIGVEVSVGTGGVQVDVGTTANPITVGLGTGGGTGVTVDVGIGGGGVGVDVSLGPEKRRSSGGRGHHKGWDKGGDGHGGHHHGFGRGHGHGGGGGGGSESGGGEEEGEDDVVISDGTIITPGAHNRDVRIGNVPTRTMNLPDTFGVDEWGNRFYYVVVEEMTAEGASALTDIGGITIQDINGNSASSEPGNIVLLLVSTGGDPRGAMDAAGAVMEDCNVDVPAGENCDSDAIFMTSLNKVHDSGDATFSHRMIYIGPDFKADK
jgi:type II secretory pathway pseudopilin PulG